MIINQTVKALAKTKTKIITEKVDLVIVAFVEVDEFYSVAELVLWPKDKHYY
jgi:stage V sporulation protein SpoVS